MYWQKFIDLIEPITSYDHLVPIGVLIFLIGFVVIGILKSIESDYDPYSSGNSWLVCLLYAAVGGLGAIAATVLLVPAILAGILFLLWEVVLIFWQSAKKIYFMFYIVLLVWSGVAVVLTLLIYRVIQSDMSAFSYQGSLILLVVVLSLFGMGVFLHYESPENISADTWWHSGSRFVIGGIPWMLFRVIYDVSGLILDNEIENRIDMAVSTALVTQSLETSRLTNILEDQHNNTVLGWKGRYDKAVRETITLTESLRQKTEEITKLSTSRSNLQGELSKAKNELINERRRNAAIKTDYEALQAKMLQEQFIDDDSEFDELTPSGGGYILLDDNWED